MPHPHGNQLATYRATPRQATGVHAAPGRHLTFHVRSTTEGDKRMRILTEPFHHANLVDETEQHISVQEIDDGAEFTERSIPIETNPTDYYEQHRIIWPAADYAEPLRPKPSGRVTSTELSSPDTSSNKLLLVTNIYPAGHQIRIEDLGTSESPDMQRPGTANLDVGEHVLFVYTMTADEADATNRTVTIRVYAGADHQTLGKRVYNGHLILTRPVLAIGDALDSAEAMLRVPLQHAGMTDVAVFTRRTIENISGPNEVNILLPDRVARTRQ